MSFNELVERINTEANARIAEIEKETEESLKKIDAQTNAAINNIIEREKHSLEVLLKEYKIEYLRGLKNQTRREIRAQRIKDVEDIFNITEDNLSQIVRQKKYKKIWGRFYDEALAKYKNERNDTPVVKIAPEDKEIALSYLGKKIPVEIDENIYGGLELRDPERNLRIINTVKSRLARGKDQFLKLITDNIGG